jgi:hypothetical protein
MNKEFPQTPKMDIINELKSATGLREAKLSGIINADISDIKSPKKKRNRLSKYITDSFDKQIIKQEIKKF